MTTDSGRVPDGTGHPSRVKGPTFEQCAAVVAAYIAENRWPDAVSCAAENQCAHGFCECKLLDRANEIAADSGRFKDVSGAYQTVGEMLEYFDSYRLATWAPLASIIIRERECALEAAAQIADRWAAENRAAARRAGKSMSEASASFADQLDGAAIECNAIAGEIRKLAQCDTRRMAETALAGSGRSPSGTVAACSGDAPDPSSGYPS